jgi:tRNA (mo5U34)-methyltransferase
MIDYSRLFETIKSTALEPFLETLPDALHKALIETRNGNLPRWLEAYNDLPEIVASRISLGEDTVTIGDETDCDPATRTQLESMLKKFHPWRKGPFNLFGIHIDTEWHSDWKWRRLAPHISPLKNRTVLDVGCGNGYFIYRMLAEGARTVIGVDPSLLFLMQFETIRKYASDLHGWILPIGIDEFEPKVPVFDTVLSMGVIYHRKDPVQHIKDLYNLLNTNGELILETLIIDEQHDDRLIPDDRYAMMRNVWCIPSCKLLEEWAKQSGFEDIRIVDRTVTTVEEQHATEWMQFQSLPDFLDPEDPTRTIEGYPAPERAIMIAKKT